MQTELLVNKVPYYLPLSRVRIHGTLTTTTPPGEQAHPVVVSSVLVDLLTTADPNHPRYVLEADSLLADRKLSVEATDKGLLLSTNASSAGKLGAIVTNVFGAVLRLGLLFGGAFKMSTTSGEENNRSVEDQYAIKFPRLAAARAAAMLAISDLTKAIADGSKDLISESDPAEIKKKRERLQELAKALDDVKKEGEALERHFNAWRAGAEKKDVVARDYIADVAELPAEETISALQGKTEAEVRAALPQGGLGTTLWDLRAIVANDTRLPDPVSKLPKLGEKGDKSPLSTRDDPRGVEFRLPRPAFLSLFAIEEVPGAGGSRYNAVLKERREVAVSDAKCVSAILLIKGNAWSENSLDVEFSDAGSVKKISTNNKAELAAFAEMLGKLPGEALAAVKDANAFIDERQKLALQGIEQRIEELKKEKEEATARIARNETLATEQQAAEIARLDKEISLLQKQIQLKQLAATEAGDVQLKLVKIEEELVKARAALEQAEIERLKVQAELKKTQQPGPTPPPPPS